MGGGHFADGVLHIPASPATKAALVELGALHRNTGDAFVLERYAHPLLRGLGLTATSGGMTAKPDAEATDPLAYVSAMAGFPIRARGPTRIGARLGRPEKAAPRKMQPAPHVLFPLGKEGGAQRLVKEALRAGTVAVEVGIRTCASCGKRWFLPKCTCGGHTVGTKNGGGKVQTIPLAEVWDAALARVHANKPPDVKGVQGMISASRTPEILERGVLRAKHDVNVFKDGTVRFDMTNLPLTHFRPSEVGLTVERTKALGYDRDMKGNPLVSVDQIVELRVQDVIVAKECGDYLVRVAGFVDELLEKVYGMEPFYRAKGPEDLIGHAVVTLAPHTSGGVLARLIAYTPARAAFAHPFLIAARRRNCDGDEDSMILLMDALLNFSRSFLPESRGGLMDAPLVLSTRIDPNEVDKEAHNLDVGSSYSLEFYEATLRFAHPREVESTKDLAGRRVGSVLQYEGFSFTHEGGDPSAGPVVSTYTQGAHRRPPPAPGHDWEHEGVLEPAVPLHAVRAEVPPPPDPREVHEGGPTAGRRAEDVRREPEPDRPRELRPQVPRDDEGNHRRVRRVELPPAADRAHGGGDALFVHEREGAGPQARRFLLSTSRGTAGDDLVAPSANDIGAGVGERDSCHEQDPSNPLGEVRKVRRGGRLQVRDLHVEGHRGPRQDHAQEDAREEAANPCGDQAEPDHRDTWQPQLVPAPVAHERPVVRRLREAVRTPFAGARPRRPREEGHAGARRRRAYLSLFRSMERTVDGIP
ncbi:MAG: hypothetical protein E6K18_06015 [Methanobacteriota archaeon]|nr:MAG: hypothetical protein E6K18_06015 [Euryarchaeota archaeon]